MAGPWQGALICIIVFSIGQCNDNVMPWKHVTKTLHNSGAEASNSFLMKLNEWLPFP